MYTNLNAKCIGNQYCIKLDEKDYVFKRIHCLDLFEYTWCFYRVIGSCRKFNLPWYIQLLSIKSDYFFSCALIKHRIRVKPAILWNPSTKLYIIPSENTQITLHPLNHTRFPPFHKIQNLPRCKTKQKRCPPPMLRKKRTKRLCAWATR